MPPIPVSRVKSGWRCTSQFPPNLISCALKSAISAIVKAGKSSSGCKLLPFPLYGEPAEGGQLISGEVGGAEGLDGGRNLGARPFDGAAEPQNRGKGSFG